MKQAMLTTMFAAAALAALLASAPAVAQDAGAWGFDPGILAASGGDLLRRAPNAEIDGLFQALHAATQSEREAPAVCTLFESDADRSLEGLNAAAARLGPASRERFGNAIGNVLVAAVQSPPQAFDAALARQSLKAAGVTAAILHDGFITGLDTSASDPGSRAARCQSLRWLLDAMQSRPQGERAAMTRLLLDEGLARLAPAP